MNVQAERVFANVDRGCPRDDAQKLFLFKPRVSVQAIRNAVTLFQLEIAMERAAALNRLAEALIAFGLKGGIPKQSAAIRDRDFACEARTAGEIAILSLLTNYRLCDTRPWQPRRGIGS